MCGSRKSRVRLGAWVIPCPTWAGSVAAPEGCAPSRATPHVRPAPHWRRPRTVSRAPRRRSPARATPAKRRLARPGRRHGRPPVARISASARTLCHRCSCSRSSRSASAWSWRRSKNHMGTFTNNRGKKVLEAAALGAPQAALTPIGAAVLAADQNRGLPIGIELLLPPALAGRQGPTAAQVVDKGSAPRRVRRARRCGTEPATFVHNEELSIRCAATCRRWISPARPRLSPGRGQSGLPWGGLHPQIPRGDRGPRGTQGQADVGLARRDGTCTLCSRTTARGSSRR